MISDLKRDMVALNMVRGFGPRKIKGLLEKAAGGPVYIKEMDAVKASAEYARELEYIEKNNIKVLCLEEEGYPPLLKDIYDPPPVLYCRGSILKSDSAAVAIVGSRRCSSYGQQDPGGPCRMWDCVGCPNDASE